MYVSARDRYILDLLIQHPEGVTIGEIARALQVSERTIHRDLTSFDTILHPYELTLEKKTGKGIFLKGAKEQIEQFTHDLKDAVHFDFLPEQRQVIMTCQLLESFEPVKLQALASDLNITVATVSNDLEKVEQWLAKYDLKLEKRRGFGILVTGNESAKRRAISGILSENFDQSDILHYIRRQFPAEKPDLSQSISEQLLGFINVDKLKKVEEAVENISRPLDYHIADSAYIALVVHLTLAIERISKGENINMNHVLMERLKAKKEFALASKLAGQLEKTFAIKIPDAEVGYITMHLRGAKLRQDKEILLPEENLDTARIARKLIETVSNKVNRNLQKDVSLYQGLVAHLDPALYRLKEGMHIYNPLQEKIQSNYPELFKAVKDSFQTILPEIIIPDEETGFLVLHFGSAIERDTKRKTHSAVVICSTGIGSSKMMSTRLQNEFPNITEVENISLFELDDRNPDELDLIISTIPLVDHDLDYVQVNPFLTNDDVVKIQTYINRQEQIKPVKNKPSPAKTAQPFAVEDADRTRDKFMRMQQSLQCSVDLLDHFSIISFDEKKPFEELLRNTIVMLKEKGLVTNTDDVAEKLKLRAELAGVGIPGTQMALYHTRSRHVFQPVFMILQLKETVQAVAMDGNAIGMNRVLIMLGPDDMTHEESQILSTISGMIIENDESIHVFEEGSAEDIRRFISGRLMSYHQNYFNEGE